MSDEDDPHYPEFQRLLARLLAESRAPEGETDEQCAERMARYYEIERQLHELYRPVVGVDYDPPSTPKGANLFITPDELHPAREWIRDTSTARIMPDGFLQTERTASVSDREAIKRAAESIRDTSPGAKLLAGQLTAHHILCGLSLPDEVLRALGMALGQGRRWEEHLRRRAVLAGDAAGKSTLQIATELGGIDTSMVRRLRRRKVRADVDDDPPRDARKLWDQVADLSERGLVLPPHLFHSVIVALGLTDEPNNGQRRLRQHVLEAVAPQPQPEVVVGALLINGQPYRIEDELPALAADEADVEFVARERLANPRVGLRWPEDYRKAVMTEAAARAERGEPGEPALGYQELADDVNMEFNRIRTWAATETWERDVYTHAFWLTKSLREATSAAVVHEARSIVRDEPKPSATELATRVNATLAARAVRNGVEPYSTEAKSIAAWRTRTDYWDRVAVMIERLLEAATADRAHDEALAARQPWRTRDPDSN